MATGSHAQAPEKCGTMDYLAEQKINDPALELRMQSIERDMQQWISEKGNQKAAAVITIPVVVHVVYNTSSQNISDARIIEQINVLNKDFSRTNADAGNTPSAWQSTAANTNIQFCLAKRDPNGNATNGIVRKSTTTTSFSTNNNVKFSSSGGDNAWPSSSYLNIWVCNLSGGVLGYAQFPGGSASTDGVVLLYSSVGGPAAPGTATPYHLGRTATHEVGHWLNLYHIWGDDGTSCSGSDQVSDTPNQADENYGCPAFPAISCSNGPNGDMFMNYMDYTNDACMNMFTNGQSTRMNATLNGSRAGIQSSLGCTPPGGGGTCAIPSGLTAGSITQTSATLNWSIVSGAVSYNVQYRVNGTSTWTNTSSTTNSKAISGLSAGTSYQFQVQTVCAATTSAYSAIASFTTSPPACADNYEPNGSRSAAPTVSTNTNITGLISTSSDVDFFRFTTTSPNTYIKITLSNLPADYDMKLQNSTGSLLATSQNGGTSNEVIIRNTANAATYYVKLYGYSGAFNTTQCYNLFIQSGSSSFRTSDGEILPEQMKQALTVFPNPATDAIHIKFHSSGESAAALRMFDVLGNEIKRISHPAHSGINELEWKLYDLSKGIYFLELSNEGQHEMKKVILN